ncbi:MAG TPA: iron ABC transporter permease [Acidimicrobiia bacterium]|jgi:iron complex transport system permease protein|nr:iron ABC transporter permease [Acidimicrobiia bacterium]
MLTEERVAAAATAAPSDQPVGRDRRTRSRAAVVFPLLGVALVVVFVLGIAVGSVAIPVLDVVRVLTGHEPHGVYHVIVQDIRLPRSITGVLVGAALGVAGLQMQTLFRNPLADPFVLGVSAGASLGVAIVVLAGASSEATFLTGLGGLGQVGIAGAGTAGAALVMALVLVAARRVRSTVTILVVGLMVSYLVASLVTVLIASADGPRIQQFLAWEAGSFRSVTWQQLHVLVPVLLVGLAVASVGVKQLNALLLGERYAATMGVNVRRTRVATIGTSALLAGVATAFCGPIGFLGIAIPHLARAALGTSDHRLLLPASMLLGGTIALAADITAQLPGADFVLPLNAVTALLGAPIVIWVVLSSRSAGALGA